MYREDADNETRPKRTWWAMMTILPNDDDEASTLELAYRLQGEHHIGSELMFYFYKIEAYENGLPVDSAFQMNGITQLGELSEFEKKGTKLRLKDDMSGKFIMMTFGIGETKWELLRVTYDDHRISFPTIIGYFQSNDTYACSAYYLRYEEKTFKINNIQVRTKLIIY